MNCHYDEFYRRDTEHPLCFYDKYILSYQITSIAKENGISEKELWKLTKLLRKIRLKTMRENLLTYSRQRKLASNGKWYDMYEFNCEKCKSLTMVDYETWLIE